MPRSMPQARLRNPKRSRRQDSPPEGQNPIVFKKKPTNAAQAWLQQAARLYKRSFAFVAYTTVDATRRRSMRRSADDVFA
jgi:hypothetical protein